VIRRSQAVSEALAEGMTVVDYAPEAPVSQDYMDVASWLRSVSPPAKAEFSNQQWSQQ
jgi:cellulose biosynthesis protein BcsQ